MTKLELCNWALLKLGQRPLPKRYETHPHWVLCNTLLSPIHRGVLRSFHWNFATRIHYASPMYSSENDKGSYSIPKRCVRVQHIDRDGTLVGDRIVPKERTDASCEITFIEEVALADCDPLYLEAIACKLASEMCLHIVADTQLSLRLKAEYAERIKLASERDGTESSDKLCKRGRM